MSLRALHLEDFGNSPQPFVPELIDGDRLEEEKIAAFDRGYADGWDDAMKSAEQQADEAKAAVQSRLQDLSFTFHEARAHVMQSMAPMLEAIVRHAVPKVLSDTLGQRLVAEFEEMLVDAADDDVMLLVAPNETASVAEALAEITALPVTIEEDSAIEPGQLHLRLGLSEREIDLGDLTRRLDDAISALTSINKEVLSHG